MIRYILSFLLVMTYSCSLKSKSELAFFQVPNVGLFEQKTILGLEKTNTVFFSQYEGFYITTKDSVFKKIVLETQSQDIILSNEISKNQIEKLKNDVIKNLSTQYLLENKQQRLQVESAFRSRFKLYSILEQNDGFWVKDKCNNVIAKIAFNNSIIPNFKIIIYPSSKQCL